MKTLPTPTLDKLLPAVAALPEPFTLRDIMAASGMPENPVRAALMSMKTRGWVENTGQRVSGNHAVLWARTRWFGADRARASADMQRIALEQLGLLMAGWRIS